MSDGTAVHCRRNPISGISRCVIRAWTDRSHPWYLISSLHGTAVIHRSSKVKISQIVGYSVPEGYKPLRYPFAKTRVMGDTASTPDAETLRTALQALAAQLGKAPTVVDMHEHGDYHPQVFVEAFGGWDEALEAADIDPDDMNKQISELDLLSELQRLARELGRPPKKTELAEQSRYSAKTYQDRFGSWNNALQAAMLETRDISDRDLTRELQRLADELGRTPRPNDMTEHGKHGSVTYYRRFNSWNDALQQANLPSLEASPRTTLDPDMEGDEGTEANAETETAAEVEGLVTSQELARTYHSRAYGDPWKAVMDYQRVLRYTAEHSSKGSSAVASALDLPRSRIRPWMEDDARPDAVRGIETAEANNWIPLTADDEVFPAFNVLVAWIFSGGSINQNFVPSFAVDRPGTRRRLTDALESLNVSYNVVREAEQERATEVRPTRDASVLGRILTVLGAPQGKKNEEARISLPEYLESAPLEIQEEFVDVYLLNRGQTYSEKDMLSVRESRSRGFLEELAALFRGVSGGDVSVSEKNVHLSAEATRNLYGKFGPQWG